jgi:hypothetical protein
MDQSQSSDNGMMELLSLMGQASKGKFSPAVMDLFVVHLKKALAMAENVPPHVMEAAENFRLSIKQWSADIKEEEQRKTA